MRIGWAPSGIVRPGSFPCCHGDQRNRLVLPCCTGGYPNRAFVPSTPAVCWLLGYSCLSAVEVVVAAEEPA